MFSFNKFRVKFYICAKSKSFFTAVANAYKLLIKAMRDPYHFIGPEILVWYCGTVKWNCRKLSYACPGDFYTIIFHCFESSGNSGQMGSARCFTSESQTPMDRIIKEWKRISVLPPVPRQRYNEHYSLIRLREKLSKCFVFLRTKSNAFELSLLL